MKSIFIAVLLLTVNAFGAVRIPSEELVLALERGKVLTDYELDQEQSREEAYTIFDQYIDRKLGHVGQVAAFAACPEDKKQKISRFVRTLLNFVGWSRHSKALLDESGKTYNQYLNLIDVISPYEIKRAAKNNLKIAKARLQRLALESQMREEGRTYAQYEQAHPHGLSRRRIYNLLAEVTQGVKVRFLEKANLIVTCGYSPTGNEAEDLDLAEDIMDKYSEVKHNDYFHRQHRREGPARKRIATAVPYLSLKGSEVSAEIYNRAHDISVRIAMLRNALPVNGGGDSDGGGDDGDSDSDSDSDNDGGNGGGFGFASAGASSSSTSVLSSAALTTFGISSSSAASDTADMEQDDVASSSFLTPAASDTADMEQDNSDNDDSLGGGGNGLGFASAGASAAYDSDDSDFPRSTTGTKRKNPSAIIDSSDEEEVSKPVSKKRVFLPREKIQERNERIRVALEVNPELDRSEIAKIVGSGVTAQNVFDYIHHYAPQYKKPGRLKSALAEKKSRIRAAFEADLISHQQGNPRKTYAEIAAIAGPDVTVGNIEIFIAKLGEEGKQFKTGPSRGEVEGKQQRIRRAIEENSGKPLAEIARIAGSDVTTDAISNFKKKHKLTKKTPTTAEVEAKERTVIAIKTANPQVTASRIVELAAQQGCKVSEAMVHKYIVKAGLQQKKSSTPLLTQVQKDRIMELRDAGGTFPDIATTVGYTQVQAYKYYNKK